MSRHRRFVGRALAAGLCATGAIFLLAGCAAPEPEPEAAPAEERAAGIPVKAAFIYVSPVGDAGWTLAHDNGRKVIDALDYVETAYTEAVPEGAEAERTINQYVRQGYNLIFTTSFGYMDPTINVAQSSPDVTFMHCSGFKVAPNVGTYFGRMYQPRYLSGIIAGKMTKSNVVGYVAAHPIPEVIRGINAFTLGVRSVNPTAKVHVVWTQTWYDPAKEREAAESLLDIGADVVTQHQDTPAPQQAAEKRGKFSIGYNSDMSSFAPEAHLTAPVWNWGVIYKRVAEEVHNGTWTSYQYWGGMADGVVALAPYSDLVPQEVRDLVEAKKAEIVAGSWDVFTGPIKDQAGAVMVAEGERMADADMLGMTKFVEGVVGQTPKKTAGETTGPRRTGARRGRDSMRPGASAAAETQSERKVAVSMQGITKRFPGVLANDRVDLELREGEIHALLGENGAGKSTLMNVLTGIYRADAGTVSIWGEQVELRSPRHAIDLGIGMVHQHFKLVPTHTVAENILLGLGRGLTPLESDRVEDEILALSGRYGLEVDPSAYVWQLSIGEQQRVEILKMLYRGARILLLDEPTAVLTPQECEDLGATLRSMRDEGHSIVFISHKLDEVMTICDRVTVLRGGCNVGTVLVSETDPRRLSNLMVGREIKFETFERLAEKGDRILEVEGLSALSDRGVPAVKGVSFSVAAGEILGFAGVAGNGQEQLAEAITGLRTPTAGSIRVHGRDMTGKSARHFIDAGVSYVPSDRHGVATVGDMSVTFNSVLRRYRERKFARGPFLYLAAALDYARRLIREFNILTPSPETPVRMLSGGNLQKVILAREITTRHELLVVMSATRGLDVGATEFVRETLNEHRSQGSAIVLISEDLEELLSLSDRIAVLFHGQIMGIVDADRAEVETLGLMMAGQRQAEVGL